MPVRTLVKLADRYPGTSRMTFWRWRRDHPDFPSPIVIAGTAYYLEHELTAFEESRRTTFEELRRRRRQQEPP